MHLLQQDKTRRKRLKRSNTTSIFSLLGTSTAKNDDALNGKDNKKKQHRPLALSRKTTQALTQYRPVRLAGRDSNAWPCLDNRTAEHLSLFLPSRVTVALEWHLLYSMDQHGSSLQTLYNKVQQYSGPCLLVIQTTDEEPLHYGSGECFLWKLPKDGPSEHPLPAVYRWTGKNDYLIYASREYLSMGGGDGRVGLWLDRDLLHGHTETCATFDNEPLTSEKKFECLALEIWGFRF
ncbi:TLD-domain-containing protein [Dichotomocladium elegans]|nr:TLD-domain-containing protein [Dichotomocladium elegans]